MNRIAVFARRPVPGRVKTRLSPALPAALACDLYRAMLEDALAAAAGAGAGEQLVYWDDPPGDEGASPAKGFAERQQQGPDLGTRLEAAFVQLLRAEGDRALVIGADCPLLDAAMLRGAFEALGSHDLVLGPTRDGGYYLVGLRRCAPQLFQDIPWSTERVFGQSIERARGLGLTIKTLAELEDLDTPADLVRWLGCVVTLPDPPRLRTVEALEAMKLLPGRA